MKEKYYEAIIDILDYIDEGIQIVDEKGRIVYYNKAARVHDGIEDEEAIGRHILEIYPSLTFETSTILKSMQTLTSIMNQEQEFVNYKGDKISTVNSSIPIRSGKKIIGAIEISKNITKVKELSEKIVDLQSELYKPKFKNKKSKSKNNGTNFTFVDIIGQNREMLKLKTLAFKASQTDSPVLIGGSTGTGKELFVHAIHNASNRKDYPFIAQNCAALPANLLESILFGSVKGSFTGANDRPGLFELADGGTLFLDEINSMPLELQAKLLRVLQDKKIRRVGGSKTIDVDVRIVAAYNSNLKEVLEKKQLRRDLFYRLNVISMIVPDLKDRKDDLPILLDYFIEKYNKKNKKFIKEVSDTVMNIFMKYDWPGNVRELEHVIEGISSIYDIDIIREEHLPYHFIEDNPITNVSSKIEPLNKALERKEKELIFTALNKTDGNVTRAAELLEIPRQTLQYRIKKFDIQP